MNEYLLRSQLKVFEEEFKNFMSITAFPQYELRTKSASVKVADTQGYESVATTQYQPQNGIHSLLVSKNIKLTKELVFHEFTHILDSEMYTKNDRVRYLGLSGFTEYHASQVELAQLLGGSSIDSISSFSMNTIITTISGKKSVYQYVEEKHQLAAALFNRDDFPMSLEVLKSAIGVMYNYWGLRSICEMYATDYVEITDNVAFLKFIPTHHFTMLNNLMHGWLDEDAINLSINIYIEIIFPIIKEYKLA